MLQLCAGALRAALGQAIYATSAHTVCFTGALIVAWLTLYAAGRVCFKQ